MVDFPFDCFSMRSMPSGSQAKSTSKISLFDALRRFAFGTANREQQWLSIVRCDLCPRVFFRVVIVGGGFGGLTAAKALRKTSARIILIDCSNHHLFRPLPLSGCDFGPHSWPNRLADSRRSQQAVQHYGDPWRVELILATGVTPNYFGHDEFAPFAPD
jgi:hypothetical protein